MADYYVTQERAMAPGISGEWPRVIPKPGSPNGRLVKMEKAQEHGDWAIKVLEKVDALPDLPPGLKAEVFLALAGLRVVFES